MNSSDKPDILFRLLFMLVFLFAGYFSNAGSWNQNARLNSIFSYVEPGPDRFSFHFDRYMPRADLNIATGDWSRHKGHYYSNKAPGTTLLGIIPYSFLYLVEHSQGVDLSNPYVEYANRYIINLALSVFPLACGVLAFAQLLLQLGKTRIQATAFACIFCFATLMLPYSTQLWGHPTAASLIVISLAKFYSPEPNNKWWSGWYAGLAVCVDYFAVFAAVGIFILACFKNYRDGLRIALGAVPALGILLVYHYICFGSPLALPTDYTNPEFIDPQRAIGLFGMISLSALWQLTFGPMRGIFFTMPILILSLHGFYCWIRNDGKNPLLWLSLLVVCTILLLNASFNGWHAGASVGARYQIVALPFWILPLIHVRGWLAKCIPVFATISVFQMLATAAVSPIAPDVGNPPLPNPSPMIDWVYTKFLSGELAQFIYPMRLQFFHPNLSDFIGDSSWNIGMFFGLRGLSSIIPLILLSAVIIFKMILHEKNLNRELD